MFSPMFAFKAVPEERLFARVIKHVDAFCTICTMLFIDHSGLVPLLRIFSLIGLALKIVMIAGT
jgi:hypothetical protein